MKVFFKKLASCFNFPGFGGDGGASGTRVRGGASGGGGGATTLGGIGLLG